MAEGRVKWFDEKKGFGFISMENGEDVFVHFSEIEVDGFKTLSQDQKVSFEIKKSDKGLQAVHVKPM